MEQQTFMKRRTACRFWIRDLLNAKLKGQEGIILFDVREKEVSRVNVIAVTVDKQVNEERTFATLTLDDGTETIRVKTWKEDIKKLENTNIGEPVLIIGKLRLYGGELAIIPEIVKKQEIEWLLVRKKEMETEYGQPEELKQQEQTPKQPTQGMEKPQEITEEEVVNGTTETSRQKILEIIEKETAPEGAQISQLVLKSGLKEEKAEQIIDELLKEGEVFQPRTGFLKVI